ncbi:hypothetical protein [Kitasatospora sp. DSM 101779]|uniref:hypothetical protein n=1 Tax=Kitasatospora sp. DSM 101779 TaxID=2853165 RepID=UPI0021D8157E|nr:hypothetical protein [Kitasatospora sp. DSM 101779]MCU7820363.1 hypothetical protein [Kitasatospora sp. DSM 101779]
MISPRVVKAGLVQVDTTTGRALQSIALQYNPDALTRTVTVQAAGADPGQALRLKGVAVETLRLEAEVDATDRLEFPAANPGTVEFGIHPQLAALELLVNPRAAALAENDALAGRGVLEVLPVEAPLTLFVWSRQRVVPVRVTELSIAEEAFDASLNPIRAKVTLGMRVLSVDDLGFAHRGGALFMSHLRNKEALAARAGSAALTTLGLEVI